MDLDTLKEVEDLFLERGKELAWLGVLLMLASVGIVPFFWENALFTVFAIVVGIILWFPYIYMEYSED